MFILNEKPLQADTAFTHDDLNYPANWLRIASFEEKQAIGIVEVPDPEPVDSRFYWTHDNPKDLEQLKAQWTQQINITTSALLTTSDWMIIRKMERKIKVPELITEYRRAVIAENTRLTTLIDEAQDVPALIAVIDSQAWPQNPNNQMI